MILYSDTIQSFIARVKKYAFSILAEEAGLTVRSQYLHFQDYRYKLQFVVFSGRQLGTCHPRLAQIALNCHFNVHRQNRCNQKHPPP